MDPVYIRLYHAVNNNDFGEIHQAIKSKTFLPYEKDSLTIHLLDNGYEPTIRFVAQIAYNTLSKPFIIEYGIIHNSTWLLELIESDIRRHPIYFLLFVIMMDHLDVCLWFQRRFPDLWRNPNFTLEELDLLREWLDIHQATKVSGTIQQLVNNGLSTLGDIV